MLPGSGVPPAIKSLLLLLLLPSTQFSAKIAGSREQKQKTTTDHDGTTNRWMTRTRVGGSKGYTNSKTEDDEGEQRPKQKKKPRQFNLRETTPQKIKIHTRRTEISRLPPCRNGRFTHLAPSAGIPEFLKIIIWI